MRHHDPAGKLLKTALAELELSDEQRTALEGLRDKAHESRRGWHKGDKPDRHQMLIAALEGGEIDESACQARHQAKSEKIEQHLAARDERLATLHTTLTAEQRTALVEKVRARMADHGARIGEKAGRHGGHGRHHRGHHGPRMLKKLTAGLELSDEQQAAIDALVEQAEARRPADEEIQAKIDAKHARIVELLDAFADEGFDPAKLTKPEPMRQMAERHGCHKDQLEGLIEILTPEQRAELVEQIKAKPFGKRGCRGKGDCDGMGDCGRRGREHGPRDGSGPRAETGYCPYAAD